MLRNSIVLLAVVAAFYVAYAGLLTLGQRNMMFPIAGGGGPPRLAPPPGAELAEAPATFGAVRLVLLRAAGDGPAPAVIVTHGNAELAEDVAGQFAHLTTLGLHVLVFEYPGYADAAGAPTRATLVEAATVAYDWLAARADVDRERIAALGVSIGSGPVAELATLRPVRALALCSGFARVSDFALGMGLPRFLVRDDFDNVARVRLYPGPVLVLHGRHDGIIPYAHGERLAAATPRARLVPLECGHNDCPYRTPELERWLAPFLREAGVLR